MDIPNREKLSLDLLKRGPFYNYHGNAKIPGYMELDELAFLYNLSKHVDSVVEIGSWMGRSTNAILNGCRGRGRVIAVDTFLGSDDDNDLTQGQGEILSVYDHFKENTKQFTNLEVMRMPSIEAAAKLNDQKFDMIFIDANHTYEGVRDDIRAWRDKASILLCGHDYTTNWPGVVAAVHLEIGPVDFVFGTIWGKFL